MTFAEQITAFRHFFNQLFKADALPFTFAAFTNALHRFEDTQRAVQPFHQCRTTGTGGGTSFQAAFAAHVFQGFRQWRVIGDVVVVRERMIRVTGNADHLIGFAVNTGTDPALSPAAEALSHRYRLCVFRLPAFQGIPFRDQRVTVNAVQSHFTGSTVHQPVDGAFRHIAVTVTERCQSADRQTCF